jgi:hypothetical protein
MPLIKDQKIFFVDNGEDWDDYGIEGVIIAAERDKELIDIIIKRVKNEYAVLKRDWVKIDKSLSMNSREKFWNTHPQPSLKSMIVKSLESFGFVWVDAGNSDFSFGLSCEQKDVILDRYLKSDEGYIESHDKRIFKVKR